MPKGDRVFNNRPRKIFRKHIPRKEVFFGAGFVLFVGLMTLWFASKGDAYNPADRDISMEVMEQDEVVDKLYRTPLHRWVDPAKAALSGGVAMAAVDTGVFPATLLDGGWQLTGRVQAFTVESLYEKIDGAADQYIQYGLKHAFFAGVEKPEENLSVNIEVYDQETFSNALGIFGAQRDADKAVESSGGAYFYPTTVGAIGITGPYYFKITGAQEGEPTIAKAKQLVGMLAGMAQGKGDVPAAFGVFADTLQVPFANIQYQPTDVFQFSFAKDFWFGQPQEGAPKYFVHKAADAAAAKTLFDQLIDNSLPDYDAVERTDNAAVLKHKFLGEYQVLREQDGMLYGIDGAADLNDAQQRLQTLEGAFSHGEEY